MITDGCGFLGRRGRQKTEERMALFGVFRLICEIVDFSTKEKR